MLKVWFVGRLYGRLNFRCHVCAKAFTQSPQLTRHMRMHTGEKPYSCTYCGRKFAQNGNLKVHVRIHTGETPFQCTVCAKSFCNTSALKRHQKTRHDRVKLEVLDGGD